MKRFVHWPSFLGAAALVTAGASILHAFSDLPFWGCFLMVLFALLVNGWLATSEDEQPGGFNHPTHKPPPDREPNQQTQR